MECGHGQSVAFHSDKTPYHADGANTLERCMVNRSNRLNTIKNICNPSPLVYQLKDRKQYHYYHTITLSESREMIGNPVRNNSSMTCYSSVVNSPPIPFKPHYLRAKYLLKNELSPPIPPRMKNTEAVFQRQQLTEEYFENICRHVDSSHCDMSSDPAACHVHSSSNANLIVSEPEESNSLQCNVCGNLFPTINEDTTNVKLKRSSEQAFALTDLTQSLRNLRVCGWYWGDMTWKDAEMMLDQRPGEVGVFLLRDSQDPLHILTVSVRTDVDTIRHIRVEYTNGKFQLYDPNRGTSRVAANCVRHSNIITFIKLAMKHSRNGNFLYFVRPKNMGEAPIQIQLLIPISRFSCVKSLKYYSRFVIRNIVPFDDVEQLPVPHHLQCYLRQSCYYDADEDLQCAQQA